MVFFRVWRMAWCLPWLLAWFWLVLSSPPSPISESFVVTVYNKISDECWLCAELFIWIKFLCLFGRFAVVVCFTSNLGRDSDSGRELVKTSPNKAELWRNRSFAAFYQQVALQHPEIRHLFSGKSFSVLFTLRRVGHRCGVPPGVRAGVYYFIRPNTGSVLGIRCRIACGAERCEDTEAVLNLSLHKNAMIAVNAHAFFI